jgi:hypothetical protein
VVKEEVNQGHPRFYELLAEMGELHSIKNKDYTLGGDPMGNFNRVSDMLTAWGINCSPYAVAFLYMIKQLDAVGNMIGQGYEGEVEGIKDRLMDIAIYSLLAIILYDEV